MANTILNTVNISKNGQITVPKEIQTRLGTDKGDSLVVAEFGGVIGIVLKSDFLKFAEDNFEDILKYSETSLAKIWINDEDDAWDKYS